MIDLDANESAWGACAGVSAVLRAVCDDPEVLLRYPPLRPGPGSLEHRLAASVGVGLDRIVLGNGSTELIGLLIGLCRGTDAIATSAGSFVAYRQLAGAAGIPVRLAAPRPGGGLDLDALAGVVDEHTRLVFIANPDNPSGTICGCADLRRFLERLPSPGPLVVLDEAYRAYVDDPTYPAATRFLGDPRVVVLRTFSKAYGLAGLRCGWLVASPEVAARVRAMAGPFRVGRPTRLAAEAALSDADHLRRVVGQTREARDTLRTALLERGIHTLRSHASFLMTELPGDATPVVGVLEQAGVRVRDLTPYGWPRAVRITVGRPADNRVLAEVLQAVSDQPPFAGSVGAAGVRC